MTDLLQALSRGRTAAGLIALGAAAALGAALVFEHWLGYAPCALCLWQRWPYYLGIPLALLLAGAARGSLLGAGLVLLALLFLGNAGLGAWHSGIEWGFWPGPSTCSAGAATVGGNLLESMRATRIVPCDAASWRFLGLSFAGWNALISLALALVALAGLRTGRAEPARP